MVSQGIDPRGRYLLGQQAIQAMLLVQVLDQVLLIHNKALLRVALRMLHSLIQALVNVILLRFAVFMVASGVLVVLAVRATMAVFQGPA